MQQNTKAVRIPLTNIPAEGGYCALVSLGSQAQQAYVMLDTGSSTFAIKPSCYTAAQDQTYQGTPYAQAIVYGEGGWMGPVVKTKVSMGNKANSISFNSTYMAVMSNEKEGNFIHNAGGIIGLAYVKLNHAYNVKCALEERGITPPVTYGNLKDLPMHQNVKMALAWLKHFPERKLPTFFADLENQGTVAPKFSFYTLRSTVKQAPSTLTPTQQRAEEKADPANQGIFILAGGEEATDLYTGSFQEVKVVLKTAYCTNLKAVQVDGGQKIAVPPSRSVVRHIPVTNSAIDTGTNLLLLESNVYDDLLKDFHSINPAFSNLIAQTNNGTNEVKNELLDLDQWPDIYFYLEGKTQKEIKLKCSPETYWQKDSNTYGSASLRLIQQNEFNCSVLGLPLLNNYFTIFQPNAHSPDPAIVKFAPIKKL